MATPKERALAAFHAMRELGIPAETIKTKLKKLLNLYGNDWSLIERDNYGALADFMFETEEEEDHKEVEEADIDAPLGNPLSGQELPLKRPKLEDLGGGGGGKRPYRDGASGSVQNDAMRTEALLEQRRTTTTPKTAIIPDSSVSGFEIASSEMGNVSMHLDFPFVPPCFCRPNLDAVCKTLEEKYTRTYQITDANFSVKKLMEEFCESFLEAGTGMFINNYSSIFDTR